MADHVFLRTADGQLIKLDTDDNLVIQQTTNGYDFSGIAAETAQSVPNIYPLAAGADLATGDQTVTPGAAISQYTMPAGTTTGASILTMSNTGGRAGGLGVWFNIFAQGHDVTIKSAAGVTLNTVSAGEQIRVGVFFNGSTWGLNYTEALA